MEDKPEFLLDITSLTPKEKFAPGNQTTPLNNQYITIKLLVNSPSKLLVNTW